MTFAPVYPHDPIEEIAEDLFIARGSVQMNPLVRITRNMAVVRHAGELSLVNPIRLSDAELARLDALGAVKHIVRTGPLHGLDDPFYMDRYGATFWCQPGGTSYTEPPIDRELSEQGELPFPDAKLFCFRGTAQPESVLLVERGAGVLFPADSIQHYGDYSNCNLPARLLMPRIGFPRTTLLGPIWLKLMTPAGASLAAEFERLLEFEFDALLSAHGTFLASGAHAAVRAAVDRVFSA